MCAALPTTTRCRCSPRNIVEEQPEEKIAPLPVMPLSEHVLADYQMLRLSLRAHLMQFLRDLFRERRRQRAARRFVRITDFRSKDGDCAACAGIVLTRQMPGDAGVVFITLSDETGCHQCRGLAEAGERVPPRDHGRAAAAGGRQGPAQHRRRRPSGRRAHLSTARRNWSGCRKTIIEAPSFRSQAARRGIAIPAMSAWCRNRAIFTRQHWQFALWRA